MRIWLVDLNPLGLEEPPQWWQDLVFDYDKMLRIMPSQRDHAYRLCRVVRKEARLGLSELVIHDHPDTRACIKFGVVPVATLMPWAIRSNKIIRDLQARDTWRLHGGDPNKIVDAIEQQETAAEDRQTAERHAELDEINSDTYRAIRYGRRETVEVSQPHRAPAPPRPLPPLPGSQNRNRVASVTPPEGTPAPTPAIVLTDL